MDGLCACPPGYIDTNCSTFASCRYFDNPSGNWSDSGVNNSYMPAPYREVGQILPMADYERRADMRATYDASGQRDQYGADEMVVCLTEHLTDFAAVVFPNPPPERNATPYNYSIVPYMAAVIPDEGPPSKQHASLS